MYAIRFECCPLFDGKTSREAAQSWEDPQVVSEAQHTSPWERPTSL